MFLFLLPLVWKSLLSWLTDNQVLRIKVNALGKEASARRALRAALSAMGRCFGSKPGASCALGSTPYELASGKLLTILFAGIALIFI